MRKKCENMRRMKTHLGGAALKKFQSNLLAWFREHQRDLPWRSSRDPYRIWVAEIMLQQTRIAAVMRRVDRSGGPAGTGGGPLTAGGLVLEPGRHEARVGDTALALTPTEFRLLDYFARHLGRVFSRDHLLDSVWRDTSYVTPRSVDVYVRRIREKIEPDPENPRYLKTVRGAGYRFEAPK